MGTDDEIRTRMETEQAMGMRCSTNLILDPLDMPSTEMGFAWVRQVVRVCPIGPVIS